MAFRFERGESVSGGLRRVLREELESAASGLSGGEANPDDAIHEARKSVKKARALLRLLRRESGDVYSRENARLRGIAARLSGLRDDVAVIETFDRLTDRYKDEAGLEKLHPVRAGLAARRNKSSAGVGIALHRAAAALLEASKRVKAWHPPADEFTAIVSDFKATWLAGRKALKRAHKHPLPENFHELRKRIKDHWYYARLLGEKKSARGKRLKRLETWLGNDRNLFLLRSRIAATPSLHGEKEAPELALRLIDKCRKNLEDKALPLADRIYRKKPRGLVRRMKRLRDAGPANAV